MKQATLSRIVITIYFIILCLHFQVDRHRVLYPALVFPAFAEAPVIKDKIEVPAMNIYAIDDKQRIIHLSEPAFFEHLFPDHYNYIINNIARSEEDYKKHKEKTAEREAFKKYAIRQLSKMYPGKTFTGLMVVRGMEVYNLKKKALEDTLSKEIKTKIYFHEAL